MEIGKESVMALFKNLFGSNEEKNKKEKIYMSNDNMGTLYSDYRKVNASWQAQGMVIGGIYSSKSDHGSGETKATIFKGYPFICYRFNNEYDAKEGFSAISFIKKAIDTNEFISLEILEIGCYETEIKDIWEVIIWGENLTIEMFNEAKSKLRKAGGRKKAERIPCKESQIKQKNIDREKGEATYVRTDVMEPYTYEIYYAPARSVALEFLKNKIVTKSLFFLIVETPEGIWGKDIHGIYQELGV